MENTALRTSSRVTLASIACASSLPSRAETQSKRRASAAGSQARPTEELGVYGDSATANIAGPSARVPSTLLNPAIAEAPRRAFAAWKK
ncbi:hypothetical protein AAFF_G00418830 [Aldrovandia affinis]|uniref:Uncharacterized protein n=1 Tax=Aldrovandia affinis TaxID=143900 RepID=A0AAD7S9T6_9TELE|nr:hypothetical protein AAFF_G00418830 [Aldrovandia affinis]